jgi:hypothetical protein
MIIDKDPESLDIIREELPHMTSLLIEHWVRNCIEQGNEGNLEVLIRIPYAGRSRGGFDWCESRQGEDFWHRALTGKLPAFMLISLDLNAYEYIDFKRFN